MQDGRDRIELGFSVGYRRLRYRHLHVGFHAHKTLMHTNGAKYLILGLLGVGAVFAGRAIGILATVFIAELIDILIRGRRRRKAILNGTYLSRERVPATSTPYNVHVPKALVRSSEEDAGQDLEDV